MSMLMVTDEGDLCASRSLHHPRHLPGSNNCVLQEKSSSAPTREQGMNYAVAVKYIRLED